MGQLYEAADIARKCASMSALRGVSLALRPGHVHARVGENGDGKSMMFKVLSG